MPGVVRECSVESKKDRLRDGRRRVHAGGTASADRQEAKGVQGLERKGRSAYQLPGPGSVARFPDHLLPVQKSP